MISVLLVDPYDDSRELYAAVLQSLGFRVHAASNTDDACESVSLADVLVTGLQVPGRIDGIGLIRRLRNHPATHKIPIVVLTAFALLLDAIVGVLEKRLMRWQPRSGETEKL